MADEVSPKDLSEAIALFRAQAIGPLLCRDYSGHGEFAEALRELSLQMVRPPGQQMTRRYAASTLERWYYAFKQGGLAAIKPKSRSQGYALGLQEAHRQMLMQIRCEHPRVSASLILRTLQVEGKLAPGTISASTLRRFYSAQGLDRISLAASTASRAGAGRRRRQTCSGTPTSATAPRSASVAERSHCAFMH